MFITVVSDLLVVSDPTDQFGGSCAVLLKWNRSDENEKYPLLMQSDLFFETSFMYVCVLGHNIKCFFFFIFLFFSFFFFFFTMG